VAIVGWLATRAGVDAIAQQFSRIDLPLLIAALALMFADSLVKVWNWRKLIASLVTDRNVSFVRVMSWYFAGGFLGAVLPSSASTDVIRAYLSQRSLGGHGAACAASVVTLNGVGWMAGCLLGLAGIGLLALGRSLPVVATTGLVAQAGMYALTAASVGVRLPFAVWMILAPLTRIIALVPISVLDFGLIQGAHVWILALFDVPVSQAFVISTLFALQGAFIHSTVGSAAFVFDGRRNLAALAAFRLASRVP